MAIESWLNVGGVWKQLDEMWLNVSGVWKQLDEGWLNVGGVWKQVYQILASGTFSSDNFISKTNASFNTNYTSNALTLSISNGPIDITFTTNSFVQHSKNGGSFSSGSPASYADGDTIALKVMSGATNGVVTYGTATMNGDSATYNVTTVL